MLDRAAVSIARGQAVKLSVLSILLSVSLLSPLALPAQTVQPDAAPVTPDAAPVNPDATAGARALLREIDSISGHATLSGEHNFPNTVSRYSDRVYELTGHYPAVFGQDFGFSGGDDKDSGSGRPSMIKEVIRQYRKGSVIALTWHSVRPTDDEPVTFHDSVQGHLTDWEFRQVLTPGTDLYNRWARQVDVIAGYLQELQAAGVPVLFRAYHEMNGNWFWWGGRPGPDGSAALYRQIYDRFVHVHHLNNLVWVWNVNAPSKNAGPIDQYFPGAGYADILSMDIYGPFKQSDYDSMIALAGPHKPIALAEVGAMPTLPTLAAQPRWAYFMMWSGMAEGVNSPEQLQAMFHAPNVINRNDPRLPAPLPAPTTAPAAADHDATPAASALLAALYAQELSASPAPAAKRPDVVEFPLEDSAKGSSPQGSLADRIRVASKAGQTPLLRWTPASPTGGAINAPLTDFEWTELLKPGTALSTAWLAEVDAILPPLRQLEKEHVAVLWSPLPDANTRTFWWSNRPGPEGSRALVRGLHEQLTAEHHLHNLVWLWEPGLAASTPGGPRPASLEDFYPGPLGTDALMLDVAKPSEASGYAARGVQALAADKPVGVRTISPLADAAALDSFAWIDIAPTPSALPSTSAQ
jgi:mannan endo-1,4-beta-mannosidase